MIHPLNELMNRSCGKPKSVAVWYNVSMKPKLSPRLKMVFRLIPPCHTIWDIGSDHAYLPICLVQEGVCRRAYATDVKEKPVQAAARQILRYGLSQIIQHKQGNGMDVVDEPGGIILAGMGGNLIRTLMTQNPAKVQQAEWLVLQALTHQEALRKFLYESGYSILREDLCQERNRVYNGMLIQHTGHPTMYEEHQLYASQLLTDGPHPLLGLYLEPKIRMLEKRIHGGGRQDLSPLKERLEKWIS